MVIKLIKIKIKDKPDYIETSLKRKNYCTMEGIALFDAALRILKDDLRLSSNEIIKLYKDYKTNCNEIK